MDFYLLLYYIPLSYFLYYILCFLNEKDTIDIMFWVSVGVIAPLTIPFYLIVLFFRAVESLIDAVERRIRFHYILKQFKNKDKP